MKNKVFTRFYVPKCEIELFKSKIEHLVVALGYTNKVMFSTNLEIIGVTGEEVIVFNTFIYGNSEEEMNKEYENFKKLIQVNFGEEVKEK